MKIFLVAVTIFFTYCITANAQEFPTYQAKPISYDCPASFQAENYSTSYLESQKMLSLGADNWLFRSEVDLLTNFGPDDDGAAQMKRFVKALAERGTKLMLVYVPTRGLMHQKKLPESLLSSYNHSLALSNYTQALKKFRDQGLIVADYQTLINDANSENFFFKRDIHWTTSGSNATAMLVANYIKSMKLYKDFDKKEYTNKPEGIYAPGSGSLQNGWKILCGQLFPKEYVQKYTHEIVSTQSSESVNADSLFSEQSDPDITVVGSSFSINPNLNFVGFLREYLHTDISNEAVSGGGFNGSITQYISSESFQKNPPKLLIWEVQSYFTLDLKDFYREVIPMVNNGCAGKKVILTDDVKLHAGENELLLNKGDPNSEKVDDIRNKNHIIDLQFSDSNLKNLDMTIWQLNGRKDFVKAKRAKRIDTHGRYIFELKSEGEWADFIYLSTVINIPDEFKDLSVKISICHK